MIRFTCPGCETPFTVADEKAGKAGKCPKCQSQFTIPTEPNAPNESPPPLPTPPPVNDGPVEIAACPGCGSRLSVEVGDLGLDIECPNCQTQYKALRAGESAPPPLPKKSSEPFRRPSQRIADEEDEERPSRRSSRRKDEDDDEVRPSRRSRRDDDDDDDYQRSRSPSKTKPGALQAVSIMLLIGGILGIIYGLAIFASCYGLLWPGAYYSIVFGIMAIVRASSMLGRSDNKPPPKGLSIMQIICIVNCDLTNCVMGIVNLVLLGQEDVLRWYSRRGYRS